MFLKNRGIKIRGAAFIGAVFICTVFFSISGVGVWAYVPHANDFFDIGLRAVPEHTYLSTFEYHYEVLIESELVDQFNKKPALKKFLTQAAIARISLNQGASGVSPKLLENKLTETLMKIGPNLIKCIECLKLHVMVGSQLKIQDLGSLPRETAQLAKTLGVKYWIDAHWEIFNEYLALDLKIIDAQKGNIVYAKSLNGKQISHNRQTQFAENYEQIHLSKIQETLSRVRIEVMLGSKFLPQLESNKLIPSVGAQLGWRTRSRQISWLLKGFWGKQLTNEDLSAYSAQKLNASLKSFFETLYNQYYEVGLGFAYQHLPDAYIFDGGSWEISFNALGYRISNMYTFGGDVGFTLHFGKMFSVYNSVNYIFPLPYKFDDNAVSFTGYGWSFGITVPLWL